MVVIKYIFIIIFVFGLIIPVSAIGGEDKRAEKIDSLLNQFHEYSLFNGVLLAADGDEIIYHGARGKANLEWDIPNNTNTRFKIASITKAYTASLVLHLVERDKLSLSDVITDHLTHYPSSQGDQITIEHLLVQSAGIPDYITEDNFLSEKAKLEHDKNEFIYHFAHKDLEFEPGSDWNYGNSGYYVLGLIVQEVTGMRYDQAMDKYILDPLGLEDTGYAASDSVIDRLASGYVKTPRGYEVPPHFHSSAGFSAGMMYSTAEDMFKWTRALGEGKLIQDPYHLQNMITPQFEDYSYGLFVGEQRIGNRRELVFSHSGNINGFSSQLSYFSDSDYTLIILDNTQQCTARIYFAVREVLFEEPSRHVKEPIAYLMGDKIEEAGIEAAIDYFWELRENRRDDCDFSLHEFTRLTRYYFEREEFDIAIPLLELAIEIFPNNQRLHERLAEAYENSGEPGQAEEILEMMGSGEDY